MVALALARLVGFALARLAWHAFLLIDIISRNSENFSYPSITDDPAELEEENSLLEQYSDTEDEEEDIIERCRGSVCQIYFIVQFNHNHRVECNQLYSCNHHMGL